MINQQTVQGQLIQNELKDLIENVSDHRTVYAPSSRSETVHNLDEWEVEAHWTACLGQLAGMHVANEG